ncbi:MAG: trimethylamine methyltransferase family protein [Rhodobacteraceae bacterium]|nr:trimethylamine methyltransferase family protein [Paracoccaceae bacterium]
MAGRRGRGGGRSGNSRRTAAKAIEQMPWKQLINIDQPTEPLRPEGVEAIHSGGMRILEEIGIEFLHPEAVALLKEAGCKVRGETVFMDRNWVMEMISHCPSQFTITPRNPDRKVVVGGKHMAFVNVSSPPNAMCLDKGRRVGNFQDFQNFIKLTQYFNCIHIAGGYPVEPVEVHASVRHLDCLYEKLTLTDKACHAYCLGKERVEDVMEMVRVAGGLSDAEFDSAPRMYTNINSTSPLKHDFPMLDGAMRMVRRGQPVSVTPFTLAGAMAPVTLPGAVAQSVAEGLAAIALLQYINPGVPCVLGSFTSNVDMKTGAPAFGTPEYVRATQMSGQMARFYGIPLRASNACASNAPDGQAVWESMNSLWAAVQGGVNMVYHSAGWLEGGLIASYEKFVMDCELLQQFQRYMDPVLTSTAEDDIALEAIREVGSGGHFFGVQHTQDRYENAFYSPFLSDWSNYEAWEAAGSQWTAERANKIWKNILNEFEAPPMDVGIREELQAFVAKRKEEGGAPTDF